MSSASSHSENDLRVAYERDGVVVIRSVLSAEWIDRLQVAVDRVIENPEGIGHTSIEPGTGGRFSHDMFLWQKDADFHDLALESPLPGLARALMGTTRLNLFFDQLLVKDPGLTTEIKWHQDLQTFPLVGEQVISIWVPFDRVGPDNGVVTYARGSHRWSTLFRDDNYSDSVGVEVPDPSAFERVAWTLEPGDVIAHHPLTLHGSKGNPSPSARRRALSVRYAGDDIRFQPKEPNFMSRMGLPLPDLVEGDRLDHELFPLIPIP